MNVIRLKKAEISFKVLMIIICLLVIAIVLPASNTKIMAGVNTVLNIADRGVNQVKEDEGTSADAFNQVDDWLKNNVYSFLYIESEEEPEVLLIRPEKSKLIRSFGEYNSIGACKMPDKVPNYLNDLGCWVVGVVDDGFANSDDCGVHSYNPFEFTTISGAEKRYVWADDGYEPTINQDLIEQQCVSDKYCDSEGLKLLVDFYNTYKKSNMYSHEDEIYEKFFTGDLLCGSVNLGKYMWVKCDYKLSKTMKSENKKLNLYDTKGNLTISYSCDCTDETNENSCKWTKN